MSAVRDIPAFIAQVKRKSKRRRWRGYWAKPWTVPVSRLRARGYKKALWEHGKVTTHFAKSEARSKDGSGVPRLLRGNCQKLGFKLERVRHKNGGRSIKVISWYRSQYDNTRVGGARNSRHMYAAAADISVNVPDSPAYREVFRSGGIGVCQSDGSVSHVDVRLIPARWSYSSC
jgi:hypothetical protein